MDSPKQAPPAFFLSLIAERGLRQSRQRSLIVDTFFAMGGHVSIDDLMQQVRRQDSRVSAATVYRTMKLLAESGLAEARQFGDGSMLYESGAGRRHHDHLICTGCGRIVEFENEEIEGLQASVARSHDFEVESHKLELYGRCSECQERAAVSPR